MREDGVYNEMEFSFDKFPYWQNQIVLSSADLNDLQAIVSIVFGGLNEFQEEVLYDFFHDLGGGKAFVDTAALEGFVCSAIQNEEAQEEAFALLHAAALFKSLKLIDLYELLRVFVGVGEFSTALLEELAAWQELCERGNEVSFEEFNRVFVRLRARMVQTLLHWAHTLSTIDEFRAQVSSVMQATGGLTRMGFAW